MTEQALQYTAQFGEDRRLQEIFRDLTTGVCVEVGGYDGVSGSNTYLFEQLGWQCLIVEPMPDYCAMIRHKRPGSIVVQAAASASSGMASFYVARGAETLSTLQCDEQHLARIHEEGGDIEEIRVRTERLDHLLEEVHFERVDFITIDVEGVEYSVLQGFTLDRYAPKIVIIEDHDDLADDTIYRHMLQQGYRYFLRTGCNDWYVNAAVAHLVDLSGERALQRLRSLYKLKHRTKSLHRVCYPLLKFVWDKYKQHVGRSN
ncbi:MAG TPA: FkbM family methyltransferase [Armatimonadota bacterium]|jgi:FkbM family methyltransferase